MNPFWTLNDEFILVCTLRVGRCKSHVHESSTWVCVGVDACVCVQCRWRLCEPERRQYVLPEHAHLSPVLAGLQELSGRSTLLGAGVLASQGRRAGRPGGLHDPHLCQHDGSLQAPSKPGESGLLAQMNSKAVETR